MVEWSVLRCSGCRVLMYGRCVLLMLCRLSSSISCGKSSGFSPCCVLCATLDRNVRAVLYASVVVYRSQSGEDLRALWLWRIIRVGGQVTLIWCY